MRGELLIFPSSLISLNVPEAVPYWAILYLYEDPEGNVSVLSVENLVLAPGASLLTE